MTEIVISKSFGGFTFSKDCIELYSKLSGKPIIPLTCYEDTFIDADSEDEYFDTDSDEFRCDKHLIAAVKFLGDKATSNGMIKIVKIPNEVIWYISEDDGIEWVSESHRTWD